MDAWDTVETLNQDVEAVLGGTWANRLQLNSNMMQIPVMTGRTDSGISCSG